MNEGVMYPELGLFIGGKWKMAGAAGRTEDVIDPSTGKAFTVLPHAANSLDFGLAAYAFTSSNATATAIGDAIASGMVGVNAVAISTPETPFGGVKESGHGSEGGIEGLDAYLSVKFISQA
jgi:succinate-semialdehyde dehydrogenase / glutarate-semialdehyde dehydrogenase